MNFISSVKKSKRWLFCSLTIVLVALICYLGLQLYNLHRQIRPDEIVAKVNGKEIKYREIRVDPILIKVSPHLSSLKGKALKQAILTREKRKLKAAILRIIRENAIKKVGITVTEEEVKQWWSEIVNKGGLTEEDILQYRQEMLILIDALRERLKNPEQSEQIYEKRLANLFEKEEWEIHTARYNNEKKFKNLK